MPYESCVLLKNILNVIYTWAMKRVIVIGHKTDVANSTLKRRFPVTLNIIKNKHVYGCARFARSMVISHALVLLEICMKLTTVLFSRYFSRFNSVRNRVRVFVCVNYAIGIFHWKCSSDDSIDQCRKCS